ncbi:MAG: hypothetical protein LBH38_02735 [Holosporales bacterium]|jgi:head-tail adaptor|nr:hypothetical protein [Holosporales bacterium]
MHNIVQKGFLNRLSDQIEIQSGIYTISEYGQETMTWQTWRHVWAYLQAISAETHPGVSWKQTAYRVVIRGNAGFPRLFRVMWKNGLFIPTSSLLIHPKKQWIEFSMVEIK